MFPDLISVRTDRKRIPRERASPATKNSPGDCPGAYSTGAVPPLREGLDPVDIDGADAVQTINTRFWEAQGSRIIGRKAGLTAKSVRQQLGVDQPNFGVLFDDMAVPDGGVLARRKVLQPKVEGEIAFILGKDLPDPETDADMVTDAVATAHAAIEIVDSRIADWKISFADTVADNALRCFSSSTEAESRGRASIVSISLLETSAR